MKMINEQRIHEIVDQVLKENYYASYLSNAQLQYKNQMTAKRNELVNKLVDAVSNVIETECRGANMRPQVLAILLEPLVSKLLQWYKP